MVMHNNTILLCGGTYNAKNCFQFHHGAWKKHSTLNLPRYGHSAVSTQTATFIFGGLHSRTTYEYLPKDSKTWLIGKNEIPGGFNRGCAIAMKSDQEIWLIGGLGEVGMGIAKRILSFNVKDHTFHQLPFQLNVARVSQRCAHIPNTNKIIVTGGHYVDHHFFNSTEIIDIKNGYLAMASPMNYRRKVHGMGVVTINGEDKLAVFGGEFDGSRRLDNVEIFNNQTEKWETTGIKLKDTKYDFGFLTVKLKDVIDKRK